MPSLPLGPRGSFLRPFDLVRLRTPPTRPRTGRRLDPVPADLDSLYREHAPALIARLVRVAGGRVDWAENAVQEAFVQAATQFGHGRPTRPRAWLYRVARNRLVDLARHERVRLRVHDELGSEDVEQAPPVAGLATEWDDELLAMIVTACHPALTADEQVALALRILCGLPPSSIAGLFRAHPETIKKRLSSAKKKLREQGRMSTPGPSEVAGRLDTVLRVLYLVFTEGHKPRSGEDALRIDLCAEAIRLTEVVSRKTALNRPTVHAALALMKFGAARLPARLHGETIVLLEHQDRRLWDPRLIDEGLVHLRNSARGDEVTSYHHEATIAACHCLAPDFASTDWDRIVAAYDALLQARPSVVVEVNRAVATGFRDGFAAGIRALRALPPQEVLGYLPYHAALGSLAERAPDPELAVSAYQVALNLSRSPADRKFFAERLHAVATWAPRLEP